MRLVNVALAASTLARPRTMPPRHPVQPEVELIRCPERHVLVGLLDRDAPQQAANRAFRIFSGIARLNPDITIEMAETEVVAIADRLAREFPATNEGVSFRIERLYDRLVGDARPTLTILLGAVVLLLLIGCANVANLLSARATVRDREMSIRVALGASRGRLVRQLLTESLMLAAAGGLLGLIFSVWGIEMLPAVIEARVPRADGIRIDATVLAFSAIATMLTAVVFGLAPALQAARGPGTPLKEGGRGLSAAARGRALRRVIVTAETALAVVVLVGAGLLVRSFLALTARDPGFAPEQLVTFNVPFVALPDVDSRRQAASELVDRLSHIPGIDAAGAATGFPVVTPQRGTRFAIDGRALTADENGAYFIAATPGYFAALRTPVVQGRAIDSRDTAAGAPVAVINSTLAAQLFPGQNAVGHRLKLLDPQQLPDWRTIRGRRW